MRSKTFMSKINLQRGKLTVENRKSREKKRICSESVNIGIHSAWRKARDRTLWRRVVDMGPFCVTRSNPTRQLTDPTRPNPTYGSTQSTDNSMTRQHSSVGHVATEEKE